MPCRVAVPTRRARRLEDAGESRMREICMSGLTSGDWKRSHASPDCGGGAKASPTTHRKATATAPVADSTAGARRQMGHGDGQPRLIGKRLQLGFP